MILTDNFRGLGLILTTISSNEQDIRGGNRLPNGENPRKRASKRSPIVKLVLDLIWPCNPRGSAWKAPLLVTRFSESMSIRSGTALALPVKTSLLSFSYRLTIPISDPGTTECHRGGRGGMSNNPDLVVSLPSTEESNDVARDLEEKEVFADVAADVALVMEDVTEVLFSKEPKIGADSHSELFLCATCPG